MEPYYRIVDFSWKGKVYAFTLFIGFYQAEVTYSHKYRRYCIAACNHP